MKTILYNPIFINPQAYYVFPRLTRYLQPDNESTAEPANYIGTIEVKVIAYGDTTLKRTYTNTDSIYLSEFKNTWIRISLFTKVGSCVLGEWKIGNMESDLPYIDPEVLASLKAVVIVGDKTNNDSDRAIIKNLVDPDNPFIISNAAFKLNSGFGKYEEDFTDWRIYPNIKVTDSVVTTDGNFKSSWFIYKHSSESKINEMNIKVSGIPKGGKILYFYISDETANMPIAYTIPKDGIYHLPESKINNNRASVGFTVESSYDWNNIRIEQIPSFEGAFFTDGVEDLITSTKTVQEMGITDEVTVVSMIHQIDKPSNFITTNNIRTSGNVVGRNAISLTDKTGIYGWYKDNIQGSTINVINNILGDKADYTASASSNTNLSSKFSVVGHISNDSIVETSQVAWYWTIIANKVLTTDQINQVIAYFNLDRTLKPDILCDVKKQGITNDNHAEFGDKLIDFSGNGRDIQLNNIAWKGDSGIGKYEVDFLDSSIWNSSNSTITSSKIDCKNAISHIMLLYYSVGSKEYPDIPSFKVIKTGADIDYSYIDETGSPKSVKIVDGVNVLPASHNTLYSGSGRFCGFGNPGMGNSVTITQIPSHAGALCLDGVSDFGKVTRMPVYKDYTVVADYERFYLEPITGGRASILSKSSKVGDGSFIFSLEDQDGGKACYTFGEANGNVSDDITRIIRYQSKYYNTKTLSIGTAEDNDFMVLGKVREVDSRHFCGAIYSLMSFPYSMSEFLIERQLKKYKLGTLYPNMVEFRPVIKSNASYDNIVFYYKNEKVENGTYLTVGSSIGMHIRLSSSPVNEIKSITVNGIPATFKYHDANNNIYQYDFNLTSKSPQNINITIDEYIRFEDIVQPYPVLLRFKDENGNEVSWGGKFRVGSTITRIGSAADSNLLPNIYNIFGLLLNDNQVTSSKVIVEKTMVFKAKSAYIFDNNEPNCILSPRLLRIPNSSYKILGHIPDISGHGNNGVIHNSAYAEGSGVNEDGSYQFDGVDDFVTIPTTVGGKQVLMKVNWQKSLTLLYDQRASGSFAVLTTLEDDAVNPRIAYQARNQDGKTYIDGIENNYIETYTLKDITHNITIANSSSGGVIVPVIGCNTGKTSSFAKMSLYDFMLFDEISTDDKILELNEYVGIEGNTE